MFLLGGIVCIISILRFVALAGINLKDITFTQVDPGVWTYVELGVGITCGNLPLMRPLFGSFFRNKDSSNASGGYSSHPLSGRLRSFGRSDARPTLNKSVVSAHGYGASGFDRDSEEHIIGSTADAESSSMGKSDIEMQDAKGFQGGITVQTDFYVEEAGGGASAVSKESPGNRTQVGVANGRKGRLDQLS